MYKGIVCDLNNGKEMMEMYRSSVLHAIKVVVIYLLSCVHLFCDPMNYSLPGSSVHGISQARILEWVAISFSMGYS